MNAAEPNSAKRRYTTLGYDADTGVFELDASILPDDLRADAETCIAEQKKAAQAAFSAFEPSPDALAQVSEDALTRLLAQGTNVHGISKQRGISNVIVFGAQNIADSVHSTAVEALRARVDEGMYRLMKSVFPGRSGLVVGSSGHFWYPPGSYMSWHTNSGAPGWRAYINYAEEDGKSFFRYREPSTARIVTLPDRKWNIRIFRITGENPLWHAVYSNTNRFSLGYIIYRASLAERLKQKARSILF